MDKPEDKINGRMTGALIVYSATFMRYAWSGFEPRQLANSSGYTSKLSPVCMPRYQRDSPIRSRIPIHELLAVSILILSRVTYSWGGREKKLAELPPGGEKALDKSEQQAVSTGVPPQTPA